MTRTTKRNLQRVRHRLESVVQLPDGFGEIRKLPKLSPGLTEILDRPIDPNEKLPLGLISSEGHAPTDDR
jgi:hypothetical protein